MIYFIEVHDGALIKIGFTKCLAMRLSQHKVRFGHSLRLLGVMDGDRSHERAIHSRFHHLRLPRRELFRAEKDLLEFIADATVSRDDINEDPPPISVKLPSDVVESARIVAAIRHVTITDLLSDAIRPLILKMRDEEISKVYKPPKGK